MYTIIRRYTPKGTTKQTMTEFVRRIQEGFVPKVQEISGFHSYSVLNAANGELVTIGVFEDRSGALESVRRAAEFVKKDPLKDQVGSPEILEGELLISKEVAVGAH